MADQAGQLLTITPPFLTRRFDSVKYTKFPCLSASINTKS